MKKVFFILLTLSIAAIPFTGCKKGKEDPFISLKSRDGRITNKWKLKKIEGTSSRVTVSGSITTTKTTTTSYDGSTYTETTVTAMGSTSTTSTDTGTGTFELTIDKNGKETYTAIFTSGGSTSTVTGEGSWWWENTNKNKDHIALDGDGFFFGGGFYYVERLSGKELILQEVTKSSDSSSGVTISSDVKYTFEKD